MALAALSVALLWLLRTSPGYDPYGWLVWGYQALHLNLDLGGAPSWKPLPFLFTVPYAVFGHWALWLWGMTAVAISLAGAVFAARIVYRLLSADGGGRNAARAGAAFAAFALLGIQDYMHSVFSSQSDPMIVGLCLAAIDCHLCGRRRWTFWLLVLASLGRPETWPFCGLYALWLWRRLPGARWMVGLGLAAIPLFWFVVPVLTGQSFFIAGQLAYRSPRELHQSRIVGELGRFFALEYPAVWLGALAAVAIAIIRRHRLVLVLAAGAASWMVIEIAFVLHGWPGVSRYVMEPAAVAFVLAGVGVGWLIADARRILPRAPRWAGLPIVAVLVASLVPAAVARMRAEHADLRHERERTHEIVMLKTVIDKLGGYRRIRSCGEPVTNVGFASILAYYTKLNIGYVGYLPGRELHAGYPIVLFTLLGNGWQVQPYHQRPAERARCASLNVTYTDTRGQPGAVLIHR
jgi:hypothetical protein